MEACGSRGSVRPGDGTVRQPPGKSLFLKEEKPLSGTSSLFLALSSLFCESSGCFVAVALTRRNDASQPRLHPPPPQRNRLFGKKRVCVAGCFLQPRCLFLYFPNASAPKERKKNREEKRRTLLSRSFKCVCASCDGSGRSRLLQRDSTLAAASQHMISHHAGSDLTLSSG